jgi:hypothetical protein
MAAAALTFAAAGHLIAGHRLRRPSLPRLARRTMARLAAPSVRVVTWNVDMNTDHALVRAAATVAIVRALTPPADVFMVQELTSVPHSGDDPRSSVLAAFRSGLADTHALHVDESWPSGRPYYVALFVRNGAFAAAPPPAVVFKDFADSRMGRGYAAVDGVLAGARGRRRPPVCFVTSHLESERAGAEQRKAQFSEVIALMRANAARGVVTVFGGDTNLREAEVSGAAVAKGVGPEEKERAAGPGRPEEKRKVSDAFVQAGADPGEKFTWDMAKNDNLRVDWEIKPRSRYDRVFCFGPEASYPVCTKWTLLGKGRLPCGVFCSDHWGVLVDIRIGTDGGDGGDGGGGSEAEAEGTGLDGDGSDGAGARKATKRRRVGARG